MTDEKSPLIGSTGLTLVPVSREDHLEGFLRSRREGRAGGLSLFYAVLCIVDLFGVFPVITLPKVVMSCGGYGIPVVLFVFSLQIYTAILLGRCWLIAAQIEPNIVHKSRYPYAALAELTFGPYLSKFVTILLDATVFGGGIPNLLVASQSLQLFGLQMSEYKMDFSFCWWLIIIGILLCPLMWLGSPKDMKALAVVSVVVVSSVMVTTCYCIGTDAAGVYDGAPVAPELRDLLMAYGILAFQFDIHPVLLTIQVDMEDSSKIGYAVMGGFLATGTMFSVTTWLAVFRYGKGIEANILQGLPASFPLYFVVLLVTIQLCLSSAVGNSALFQHLEDALGISRDFGMKRCFLRAGIVALGVFLGESVPRFDLVMGLVGSTLTGPLMFILPPLLYSRILVMQSVATKERQTLADVKKRAFPDATQHEFVSFQQKSDFILVFLVMCFGIIATSVATFYSWSDAVAYAHFAPPCLVNFTAASGLLQI